MIVSEKDIDIFFRKLDRSFFLEKNKELAYIDSAISIGYGQTISQPSLVVKMTKLLQIDSESTVLEIGTGSGYQATFLAEFSKKVYTIERIKPLQDLAIKRLKELGYNNVEYKLDDGTDGWKEFAPYDRIMVTAAASKIPNELLSQLNINGKMIIPVGGMFFQELMLVEKDLNGYITKKSLLGVRFVRLVGKCE